MGEEKKMHHARSITRQKCTCYELKQYKPDNKDAHNMTTQKCSDWKKTHQKMPVRHVKNHITQKEKSIGLITHFSTRPAQNKQGNKTKKRMYRTRWPGINTIKIGLTKHCKKQLGFIGNESTIFKHRQNS